MDDEVKTMIKNVSLWLSLKKCGDKFDTSFLVSILEKWEEYGELTPNQYESVRNIYEKCHVKSKMKNLKDIPYKANYIQNLIIEDAIICGNCKSEMTEWVIEPYGEKYDDLYCPSCFDNIFNKTTSETKQKRVYKPRQKQL